MITPLKLSSDVGIIRLLESEPPHKYIQSAFVVRTAHELTGHNDSLHELMTTLTQLIISTSSDRYKHELLRESISMANIKSAILISTDRMISEFKKHGYV